MVIKTSLLNRSSSKLIHSAFLKIHFCQLLSMNSTLRIWEFLFLIWQILLWVLSYLVALVVNYNIDILNYWHPKYTFFRIQHQPERKKKGFLMLDLGRRRSLFLKMTIPQLLNKYLKSILKDYKHVEGTNWCVQPSGADCL